MGIVQQPAILPPPDHRGPGWLETLAVSVSLGAVTGAVAGFVWGGIGGRVAMRVLFLTTGDRVRGLTSDDGFEIGTISFDTLALFMLATVAGGFLGAGVGIVRPALAGSTGTVAGGAAAVAGLVFGAGIVNTDGVDFRFLEPLWLAVVLFVALPAGWAATTVAAVDRLLTPGLLTSRPPNRRLRGKRGLPAWLLLAVLAALGLVDLIDDVSVLS